MAIYGAPIPEQNSYSIMNYPAPESDVLGAIWGDDSAKNPTPAYLNLIEAGYNSEGPGHALTSFLYGSRPPATDKMPAEEANQQYEDIGLKFDRPVSRAYAQTLAEKKRAELDAQKTIARGAGGFWNRVAEFGTGVAATVIDPINIGSAFIPVIGEERMAALTARVGARTARVAKGAAEGFAGAAAVEPLVYAGAQAQQYDYGFADSLLNLSFGTVLGGGLHFAAGEVADAWRSRKGKALVETGNLPKAGTIAETVDNLSPANRADILRQAVGQLASGHEVRVEAPIRVMTREAEIPYFERNIRNIENNAPAPRAFDQGTQVGNRFTGYTVPDAREARWTDSVVQQLNDAYKGQRMFNEGDAGTGGSPEVTGYKGTFPRWFSDMNKGGASVGREYVNAVYEKMKAGKPLGKKEMRVANAIFSEAGELRAENVRQMVEARDERVRLQNDEIDAMAAREAFLDPELEVPDYDNTILRAGELPEDMEAALAELDELLKVERQAGTLTEGEEAALDAADELTKMNEQAGRGILAAATCIYRKA